MTAISSQDYFRSFLYRALDVLLRPLFKEARAKVNPSYSANIKDIRNADPEDRAMVHAQFPYLQEAALFHYEEILALNGIPDTYIHSLSLKDFLALCLVQGKHPDDVLELDDRSKLVRWKLSRNQCYKPSMAKQQIEVFYTFLMIVNDTYGGHYYCQSVPGQLFVEKATAVDYNISLLDTLKILDFLEISLGSIFVTPELQYEEIIAKSPEIEDVFKQKFPPDTSDDCPDDIPAPAIIAPAAVPQISPVILSKERITPARSLLSSLMWQFSDNMTYLYEDEPDLYREALRLHRLTILDSHLWSKIKQHFSLDDELLPSYESKKGHPGFYSLFRLANFLGLPPSWLLTKSFRSKGLSYHQEQSSWNAVRDPDEVVDLAREQLANAKFQYREHFGADTERLESAVAETKNLETKAMFDFLYSLQNHYLRSVSFFNLVRFIAIQGDTLQVPLSLELVLELPQYLPSDSLSETVVDSNESSAQLEFGTSSEEDIPETESTMPGTVILSSAQEGSEFSSLPSDILKPLTALFNVILGTEKPEILLAPPSLGSQNYQILVDMVRIDWTKVSPRAQLLISPYKEAVAQLLSLSAETIKASLPYVKSSDQEMFIIRSLQMTLNQALA